MFSPKKFAGIVVAVSLFGFAIAPAVQASGLSSTQISSILSMLQAFGADQSVINNVSAALGGQMSSGLSCTSFTDVSYGNFDNNPGGRVSQLQTWLGISSNTFGFGTYGRKTQTLWNSKCGGAQTITPNTTTNTPLAVSCHGSPYNSGTPGISWGSNPSGGTGPYTYLWTLADDNTGTGISGTPADLQQQNLLATYGSTGTKNATVRISSGGQSSTSSCSATIGTPTTTNTATTINITYPQSGNSLENSGAKDSGLIAAIKWNEQNGNYPVNIWLLDQNNQVVRTIGTNVPDSGSYSWGYDSSLANGTYQIRIDVLYPSGVSGQNSANSGYFTISQSPLSQVPTIYTFTASTASISSGQPVTLSWSTSASNCSVLKNESNGGYTMVGANVGSATTYTVSPSVTTTYTLQCVGPNPGTGKDGPSAMKSLTISVPNPAPTCTLTPSSATMSDYPYVGYFYVKPNSSVKLTWTSQNADYTVLQGEKQDPSGYITYDNLTNITNTYTMSAYGKGGTSTCSSTVYVDYKG